MSRKRKLSNRSEDATDHKIPSKKAIESEWNWNQKCQVCGQSPCLVSIGLCGPCATGEADTAGGEW